MIQITENAAKKFKELLTSKNIPGHTVKLGVKPGGCSGFSYAIDFVEKADSNDRTYEAHGVKIAVDLKSFLYLNGMQIDYTEGVMNSGFQFNNPNATGSCGCGKSVGF